MPPLHRLLNVKIFFPPRLGSLSARVFETRTATRSELFSLLTYLHTTEFALPSIFSPLKMLGLKIWETLLSWHAKCPLPVVVRVSKMCVLKLPISLTRTDISVKACWLDIPNTLVSTTLFHCR